MIPFRVREERNKSKEIDEFGYKFLAEEGNVFKTRFFELLGRDGADRDCRKCKV